MHCIGPMDVTGLAKSFQLEAEELFSWPLIEYRLEIRDDELEVLLTAVRFHGVDVLPGLSDDERAFYQQQCLNHRAKQQLAALS